MTTNAKHEPDHMNREQLAEAIAAAHVVQGANQRLLYVERERLTKPTAGLVEVIADAHWVTDVNGRLALLPTSRRTSFEQLPVEPQCSSNRSFAERFAPAGTRIELVPFVFLPWNENRGTYLSEQLHGDPVREYLAAVAS